MRLTRLVPLIISLTSCEPAPLYLDVRQESAGLVAEVYETWWFGLRSSEVPCVHDMTLTRNSDAKVVWRTVVLNPMQVQCNHLRFLIVGKTPKGFYNEVPLSGALSSDSYTLAVRGIGDGSLDFSLPLNS